jgi:hypothetical protein
MGLLNKEKMAKWAMHMSRCVFQIRGYSEYKAPEGGRGEREEREREQERKKDNDLQGPKEVTGQSWAAEQHNWTSALRSSLRMISDTVRG